MNRPAAVRVADRNLLQDLGAVAAAVDPVPGIAYDLGRAAFDLFRLDAQYAALVADSALDCVGERGSGDDVRLLSFETADVSIEVQVSRRPGGSALMGQVIGADAVSVRVESYSGADVHQSLDAFGSFRCDAVPQGPVRLLVRREGRPDVMTAWIGSR